MLVMNRRPNIGERQENPFHRVRLNIVVAQDRIESLLVVSLQGPLRDADCLAGESGDFVDLGFGRTTIATTSRRRMAMVSPLVGITASLRTMPRSVAWSSIALALAAKSATWTSLMWMRG